MSQSEERLLLELRRLTEENRLLRAELERAGERSSGGLLPLSVEESVLKQLDGFRGTRTFVGKLLELLLEDVPFSVSFWDDKLKCLHCNIYNESSSDVLSKELLRVNDGTELSQAFPEAIRLKEMMEEIMQGSASEKREFRVCAGNKTIMFSVACVPLVSRNRIQGVLAILVDKTSRAASEANYAYMKAESEQWGRKEQNLRHKIKQADEAIQAKNTFLAVMSHEIRTPLNGVLGTAQVLATSSLDTEQRELVDAMVFSGDVLLAIISDVLDLTKIESGTIKLEEREYNPRYIIQQVVRTATASVKGGGIQVQVNIDDEVPAKVVGDPLRLKQVISNLVSNALKFTKEGHIRVHLKVLSSPKPSRLSSPKTSRRSEETTMLDLTKAKGYPSRQLHIVKPRNKLEVIDEDKTCWEMIKLEFAVEDTGIGIPEEAFPSLFEKFSQVHSSTTRKYGGTGLGLAICKQLVELMGGQITVASRVGEGSTFTFTMSCKCIGPASKDEQDRHVRSLSFTTARFRKFEQAGLSSTSSPGQQHSLESTLSCPLPLIKTPRKVSLRSKSEPLRLRRWSSGPPRIECSLMVDAEESGKLQFVCSSATGEGKRPSLLLAEDNKVNVMVACSMLKRLGLTADVVYDGEEALNAIQTKKYDLILMDICMPVLDGLEVTRRVRRYEKTGTWEEEVPETSRIDPLASLRLPIVAMTANALSDCKRQCAEHGMDSFVTKPLTFKKLKNVLQLFLRKPDGDGDVQAQKEYATLASD